MAATIHLLLIFISVFALDAVSGDGLGPADLRVAFLTDCTPYSAWQSVGMAFAFQQTRQPGKLTRIMCCTDAERQQLTPQLLEVMPTHISKSFTWNPDLNDWYQAYNKPGALYDWLGQVTPTEQYIMVVDSDMYLRRPLHQKLFNVSKGWAVSADYRYLDGVSNELYTRYIPHIGPRNDTLAGPAGRHADQVGGWLMIDREDLKRVTPQWLSITKAVRADPEAWRLCGDHSVAKGEKPWISEMYGYVYAAANNSVWHTWDTTVMRYPGYLPSGVPKIIHYGLRYDVGSWSFDKHWHFGFNITECAPWDLSSDKNRNHGIFPNPPRPSQLGKFGPLEHYRDLLAIETAATLNAGFCYFHLQHCPPHPQLLSVCQEVLDIYNEIETEVRRVEALVACADMNVDCQMWADRGECTNFDFASFMSENCRKACGACTPADDAVIVATTSDTSISLPTDQMAEMLARLNLTLQGNVSAAAAAAATSATAVTAAVADKSKPETAAQILQNEMTLQTVVARVARGGVPPGAHAAMKAGLLRGGGAGKVGEVVDTSAGGMLDVEVQANPPFAHVRTTTASSPAAAGVASSNSGSSSSSSTSSSSSRKQKIESKTVRSVVLDVRPVSAAVLDAGLGGQEGPHSWGQVLLCGAAVAAVVAAASRFHYQARHPNCHLQ